MRSVGVKVLKNKLSEYLRLAAGGEEEGARPCRAGPAEPAQEPPPRRGVAR